MDSSGFVGTHSSPSWEPVTDSIMGWPKNMDFIVKKRMRVSLNFDHALAVKIGKTNITVNKTD